MDRLTKAQMEFMNGYVPANIHDVYEYAAGGGIHIDPSKKGTFKAQATRMNMGVQEAASHILANKDDYSSTMVKKANFARNFAKEEGGVAQGDQGNDKMMKMIQTYAQMIAQQSGEDPNKVYQELMGQLQQMKPEQQQAAMQEIVKQVQTVSQQPAMQMGGDPSQMQQTPQQQGGDIEQLIQQIQQMLEQGAQPQEVIAQLLQLQIDPQMIVEIFVQLGMPQEQVVPVVQEVMQQMSGGQEQGMEEPAPQGMKDGGITKYPYGGMYADKKYYGNFLPQDALNNVMTDINMLAGPTAAMANIKPLKGAAAVAGIAEGIAGAFQGYRGLFNGAVFGNKNKPGEITTPQAQAYYSKYFKDTGDTWAKKMEKKHFDTPKINPFGQNTSIPSIATPPFNPNSKKFGLGFMHGGELPHAQFGVDWSDPGFYKKVDKNQMNIDPGFEINTQGTPDIDPYFDITKQFGFNNKRFGQTANYADTRGYPQNKSRIDYDKLNNFSIGPGINDNASLSYGDPYAADGVNRQVPKQTTMTPVSAYGNGVTPYSKTNQPKTNNKTIRNVSGRQIANNSLLALSAANFALGEDKRGPRPMTEAERQERMLSNPQNYAGIYTPNVQGGGNDYLPATYTSIQNYGTTGNVIARAGGQMNFAAGGQYKVSHEQLLQLLRDGAEIEFL